jgi:hypothetical protein
MLTDGRIEYTPASQDEVYTLLAALAKQFETGSIVDVAISIVVTPKQPKPAREEKDKGGWNTIDIRGLTLQNRDKQRR